MLSSTESLSSQWHTFLARWSLLAGLAILLLFGTFFLALPASQGSGLPGDFAYFDLGAALQARALYHLAVTFDAAVWLALGGFLITLAAVFAHAAPIRSTYLQACGIGQVAGLIGSYTRLTGTTAIADRYASAVPDQQAALLRSYLDIWLTVTSHFSAGGLLWSSGLVLTASVAWTRGAFPRWLAIGIGLPGIMMLAQQLANLILGADIGFLFFPAIMLLMLDFFALAWRFWRPIAAS